MYYAAIYSKNILLKKVQHRRTVLEYYCSYGVEANYIQWV